MSADVFTLAPSAGARPTKDRCILAALARRARLAAELAEVDADIAGRCRKWSYERGYRMPLRPEQIRDEIIRADAARDGSNINSGATPLAPDAPAAPSPPPCAAGALRERAR